MGYIEDVADALSWVAEPSEFDDDELLLDDENPPDWRAGAVVDPIKNPVRHVGRNDPCPCGGGASSSNAAFRPDLVAGIWPAPILGESESPEQIAQPEASRQVESRPPLLAAGRRKTHFGDRILAHNRRL